jgi:hypothetical protein
MIWAHKMSELKRKKEGLPTTLPPRPPTLNQTLAGRKLRTDGQVVREEEDRRGEV